MKKYVVSELIEKIENELALLVESEKRNQLQDVYDNLLELEQRGIQTVTLNS